MNYKKVFRLVFLFFLTMSFCEKSPTENESKTLMETWELYHSSGLSGEYVLEKSSSEEITMYGNWEMVYFGDLVKCPFHEASVTFSDDTTFSFNSNGIATNLALSPPHDTSTFDLSVSGVMKYGQGHGAWDIEFSAEEWPSKVSGEWNAIRISGEGITTGSNQIDTSNGSGNDAGTWEYLGEAGVSEAEVENIFLAADNAIPYIAFQDVAYGNHLSVMKFENDSWQYLGGPGISPDPIGKEACIRVNNGIPYVSFSDRARDYKTTIMKFENSVWSALGYPEFQENRFTFHADTPAVVFETNDSLFIAKYNGSRWVYEGSSFDTRADDFFLCYVNNTAYVAFRDWDHNNQCSVMQYTSNGWSYVGKPGISDDYDGDMSLLGKAGLPYICYSDESYGDIYGKPVVKKYDGAKWTLIGQAGFSLGGVSYLSFDASDQYLYTAFKDRANGYGVTVMQYDEGSWDYVGQPSFSDGSANYINLAVSNTLLFVAFADKAHARKASVMVYHD